MREINFRYWDLRSGTMRKPREEYGRDGLEMLLPLEDVVLMQYTGLKDKNGKGIYEGDIITTDLERYYLIVEYRNGAFMLNCNDGLTDYYDIFFGTCEEPKEVYKYGEIIGNIYDNPELLDGDDE